MFLSRELAKRTINSACYRQLAGVKCITRLNKFFSLEKIEDDFYFDSVEANHGYFKIPKNISWGDFEQITKQVKYNMDMLQFDASIGFIYDHFKAIDIIRIYAENLDIEKLKQIRSKYIERIK